MLALSTILILLAFAVSVALSVVGWFRRSVEWALLGAALACWFLAALVSSGLRIG